MPETIPYFEILPALFLVSLAVQLIVIWLSHKHDIFIDSHANDKPQRFHHHPTPRSGGIGIFIAGLSLLLSPLGWKLSLPMLLAFLSGIGEDLNHAISPKIRLMLQLGAALCSIYLLDTVVTYIGLGITLPYLIAIVFSAFAIVGVINAINIIDGFNGLASGVTLLILSAFTIVAHRIGDNELMLIDLYMMAAVLGFFVINFPYGKIFMGDGGAYMLGFFVAASGIFLASHYEAVSPWFVLNTLIYPVWEVLFSIVRKLRLGQSPLYPDRYHFHMLVKRRVAKNNPLTSVYILALNTPFVLIPTLFANNSKANMLSLLLFIALYSLLYRFMLRRERAEEADASA